jgi:hypothetical protein
MPANDLRMQATLVGLLVAGAVVAVMLEEDWTALACLGGAIGAWRLKPRSSFGGQCVAHS